MLLRDLLIACLLVAVLAASALAQTTLHYREGQPVPPEEVQRILENPGGNATRSVRLLPQTPGGAATTVVEKVPSALTLPVQFEFGPGLAFEYQ